MGWTFVYLMLILKIPIVALLTIVWWAIRSTPEESEPVRDEGGVLPGVPAKDEPFEQGGRGEAVGAVQAGARDLARRP